MTSAPAEIEAIETRLLLEAIYLKYGYDLRNYAPSSMRRRVNLILAKSGMRSLGELQHAVLTDPILFARVIDDLTVRVTKMFRDPSFHRALRRSVVPHLRPYPLLRVWHAGCASGEEVYTTAILLKEEGLYERTQIYATDLSLTALQQAKDGTYASRDLPEAEAHYQEAGGTGAFTDYCRKAYDHFTMSDELRRNLFFFQHDLVSDQAFGEMQMIVCRNVLIYFNADLKRAVLRKLAEGLAAGGFLCLGSGERLSPREVAAGFVEFDRDERIYRYERAAR